MRKRFLILTMVATCAVPWQQVQAADPQSYKVEFASSGTRFGPGARSTGLAAGVRFRAAASAKYLVRPATFSSSRVKSMLSVK